MGVVVQRLLEASAFRVALHGVPQHVLAEVGFNNILFVDQLDELPESAREAQAV